MKITKRDPIMSDWLAGLENCACECYAAGKKEMWCLLSKVEDQLACVVETGTS